MQFDKDQLKKAVKELAFEVQHFRCYVQMHRNATLDGHPTDTQAVRYALLLHMRILLDFFFGPTREDGVGVGHFRRTLPEFGAKFPKIKTPKPRDAGEVRVNLHKRLAHLTASRWEKQTPDMEYYAKHFDDMDALIVSFQDALPHTLRTVFVDSLRVWERRHPPRL
jgi:hypothetical protein